MKKFKILICLICVVLVLKNKPVNAQTIDTFKYKITLQIHGQGMMGFGPVILLRDGNDIIQTKYPEGSVLTLEGERPTADLFAGCTIHFPSVSPNPYFFNPDKCPAVSITLDTSHIIISSHIDSLQFAKIEGNQFDKAQEAFIEEHFPEINEMFKLHTRKNEIFGLMRTAEDEAKYKDELKELQSQYNEYGESCAKKLRTNFDLFKSSVYIYYVIRSLTLEPYFSVSELNDMADRLSPSLQNSTKQKNLKVLIGYREKNDQKQKERDATRIKVGDRAKDAKIYTKNNEESSIYGLIKELKHNEILVLDFWASWCGPCRKEMPFMKSLYEKYNPKGVKIIGISTDKKLKAWHKALDEEKLPYPQYVDKYGYATKVFQVKSIPSLFVINYKGAILNMDRGEGLEEFIKNYLEKR